MRAHAISRTNPFIAHLAYVEGLRVRTNFVRLTFFLLATPPIRSNVIQSGCVFIWPAIA